MTPTTPLRAKHSPLPVFIKAECANWISGDPGFCLQNDGMKDQSCRVMNGGICGYFEQCLMPLLTQAEHQTKHRQRFVGAFEEYLRQKRGYDKTKEVVAEARGEEKSKMRTCRCGKPLFPRQRYCVKCKEIRRRETKRDSYQRRKSQLCLSLDS